MKRVAVVAGQFYYGDPERLKNQVEGFITHVPLKEKAKGILVPHAGLMYSGAVAGSVYSSIVMPKTFILIGPNHTGLGSRVSLWSGEEWEVPTGTFSIDVKLSHLIAKEADGLVTPDTQAHLYEHSLEVQLPFISHLKPDTKIVPIVVMQADIDEMKTIGQAIAGAISAVNYDVVIAASSDMSHYVPDAIARRKDNLAIKRILALDPEGLYDIVRRENISMCGYMPAIIMLFASIALGAKEARLIKYSTSGEVSHDLEQVVGYAGIVVK